MRLLFVFRHSGYVRLFESTLRMLCERGHRVHVVFQGRIKYPQLDPRDIAGQLAAQYGNFSRGRIEARGDTWGLVASELRQALDYLRYLAPEYRHADKLRERARRETPPSVIARTEQELTRTALGRRALALWLRAMNRAIPRDPTIDTFLAKMKPDVLAVTPLIETGAPQSEYLRSARALGIRTALCVASWDNLTNKGLIHGPVDLVTVWNEAMKREAVHLHGVPARRVVVTGAAAFDHWFDWRPSATREAFCQRIGLPADRPYLLYLCSSSFVAPEEVPFVRRWVEQIRASALPALRDAGILVRPHPQNADQWQDVDLSAAGVVIWPRAGAAPVDVSTRSDYFDSMFHSSAVVGVNTTAEIESAILERPVHTVLAPEFRESQEGTLHFDHLRSVNGGVLHVARDFPEHLAQLDASLRAPEEARERCRRFVEAFVRPHGLHDQATPRLVGALETLAAAPAPKPDQGPVWAPLIRPWLYRSDEVKRVMWAVMEAKDVRQTAKELRRAKRRALKLHDGESPLDAPEPSAESPPEPQPPALRGDADLARRERLQRLVKEFYRLGEVDRRNFVRTVMDDIPARSFIDIHRATKPRKLDYQHADIYMRVTTEGEEYRLRSCAKESFTTEWIQTRIGPGQVFYDIGANVGAYSLVAAKKPGGPAQVFAIEPSYATVASLCANIVLNDAAAHVTPLPVALSDRTAMDVFGLRDLEPGAARHALGSGPTEDGPALYHQPVMVFRLDDLIEWFRLPPPNHIKLDVDGGELAVLTGASSTLASSALCSILVEVSTWLSGAVTELLERQGLQLESKISIKNKAGEYAVWYGLFTRNGRVNQGDAAANRS